MPSTSASAMKRPCTCKSAEAERAQDADLVPPPHDRRGHGIIDEEHADEQRDERERGEVELERADHPLDLAVAAVGGLHDDAGGQLGAQAGADGVEIGAGTEQRGDAAELADVAEIFLHVGDVHDGEMLVGAGRVLAEIEDVADVEGLGAGLRLDPERIADLEAEPRAEFAREGDDLGVAEKADDVGLLVLRVVQLEGAERAVGKDVDAEKLKIFAGIIGEAGDVLDGRRGGGDVGIVGDDGIGLFVEAEAVADDLQVGLARDDVDRGAERFERAVVDDLDGQENRHAERDAHDVERGERRMPREVAEAVGEEEPEHEEGDFLTELTELRNFLDSHSAILRQAWDGRLISRKRTQRTQKRTEKQPVFLLNIFVFPAFFCG